MVSDSLESAHAAVVGLVNDFAASEAHYLSPGYSEAQVRVSFIDKFWMALGWDVHHEHQKNPYAQEVKVEDPQKIDGSSRRADYAFFTAPDFQHPRFFCEAKKPSVQLKTDADAAFQTLRYGKSADTPLAVLTDFEQLHILDCRVKPDIDTALARSHRFFYYRDWLKADVFAEFYYLFSREAFSSGGFDAYIAALPKPKRVGTQFGLLRAGSQPVGNDFLLDLEAHRQTLAELLHAADPSLDGDSLTELVQRVLDRLIFLRFLEDKLIETEIQVQDFSRAAGDHGWRKFLAASRKLDTRYNGIVFKHHPLLDVPGRLPVDEARFADLCEQLAYTRSPYNLHYIPVHILGSIYERFLGKVITAQGGIEEKPEVRKAGGVYYTPEYIVRYICEQTVGRLVEGKSPAQIAKLRFADIACGSGSFLLGVYDLLLRAHGQWYNANRAEALKENIAPPDKGKKRRKEFIPAVVEHEGVLRLTLEKKREILLNNVFGVDLDPQAVEVAQLSLYLKLLEDETTASAHQHYLDFAEALLPSLGKNVVRGNSLIGTDILFGQFEFSSREERKLAPMDYQTAFPTVISGGGFDAIVGNPPYVRMEAFKPIKAYLKEHYKAHEERADFYTYFLERALSLLAPEGIAAMIISNKFAVAKYGLPLRKVMSERAAIELISDFAGADVFKGATVRTLVLVFRRADSHFVVAPQYVPVPKGREFEKIESGSITVRDYAVPKSVPIDKNQIGASPWQLTSALAARLIDRLQTSFGTLRGELNLQPLFGTKTGLNEAFILDGEKLSELIAISPPDATAIKPILFGRDIRRYTLEKAGRYVIYLHPKKDVSAFPAIRKHLTQFRELLEARAAKQAWYELQQAAVALLPVLARPKIVYPIIAPGPRFALDGDGFLINDKCFTLPTDSKYLLGILNSKVGAFYFSSVCARLEGENECYYEFRAQFIERFPIRTVDLTIPADKKQHDQMVQLVEAMLATQQQLTAATSETDRAYYESKAAGLDRQIDELTFDLYGLTPAERRIVTGD